MTAASRTAPLLREQYDALLADLDGVVYVDREPVPDAIEALVSARRAGIAVAYLTNNASRPARDVADHLRELGLELTDDDVVTSAQVAARMVLDRCGRGARVLAVGGPGVGESLKAAGLVPVYSAGDGAVAVVQGYGPGVGWAELAEATFAVRAGALWVATNTDLTIPTARGIAPGNGTLVAAVSTALGRDPLVAGKPRAEPLLHAAEKLGARRPLVLGDRLDTDIEGGLAAGMDTALVLTGVHGLLDAADAPPSRRPSVVIRTLRGLGEPVVQASSAGDRGICGDAVVELDGGLVQVRNPAADVLDTARAALAMVWAARDAGRPVMLPIDLLTDPRLESVPGRSGR